MAGLLYRLGRFCASRHWLVIISWILVLAISGGTFALFSGTISSAISIPGTATEKVQDRLAEKFPAATGGSGSIVVATENGAAFTDAQKREITALFGGIKTMDGVKDAIDPFAQQKQLDDARTKVTDGRTQIADARARLDAAQQKIDAGRTQLAQAQQQLDQKKSQAQAAGQYAFAKPQLDRAQAQLDAQTPQLAAGQKQITDGRATLQTQQTKLEQGAALLDLSKNIRVVSEDGSAAIGTIRFDQSTFATPQPQKQAISDKAEKAGIAGVQVEVSHDIAQGVPSVLGPGEIVGVIIAAIVLLVMLGTVIGAALPLVSAILGVAVASLAALSFSNLVEFISVTPVLGVMLGLAVGIDYSLFILNRHRSQLKRGMSVHESIGLANGTSGNAVVFAGSTVIVALLALNITGIPFLGLMGTVGAGAVLVAIIIAITLTPALLSLVGVRILKKKERAAIGRDGTAPRLPTTPMSTWRAIVTLVAGVIVLVVIALPATQMRLGLPSGASEATESTQYKAYKTLEQKFGAGQNGPLLAVAELPEPVAQADVTATEVTIGRAIAGQQNVAAVAPIGASDDRTVIAFQVVPTSGPDSETTEQLVRDLRGVSVDVDGGRATLGVAGNASANIDVSTNLATVLPIYLVVVVGLSLLILILVFRSILVPLTATLGFVLSLLATFGGITAIYQFGWLGAVFGVHDPAPILSFLPIIEIGILFGLAMDYQLFLVSGMREAYAHGHEARVSVQRGLHAGRAVVTAAAIIMTSVFSGFIFSESSTIRPIGFGLGFGVLVDAFLVRMLLIPAVMHLLGRSAWWLPRWLDRILPDVDVEGAKLEREHPATGPIPAVASSDPSAFTPQGRDDELVSVGAPSGGAASSAAGSAGSGSAGSAGSGAPSGGVPSASGAPSGGGRHAAAASGDRDVPADTDAGSGSSGRGPRHRA
ncbi:MMPL family transporter [Tersicoccus sp. Bi-70]|uniref:MMPL family transporter n=1 Tax=Tersicoccus sp. Bi-70 TaxID=1897634 RepID=UPI0009770E80|nr:MMPL family transporter [Tersicoccus sp. Bi-70]OMH31288.1 RND transporter [Tersicoccus sp. Bi-70]